MVTIELVINSIHLMGIRVTISCLYCIALEVMLLFLIYMRRAVVERLTIIIDAWERNTLIHNFANYKCH